MKLYGEELRASILKEKERLYETMARRQERIDNCETDYDDCFISIHVESDAIRACDMQLRILDGDGMMDYNVVVDENGNEVRIHEFQNKWGGWSVVGNGVFASSVSIEHNTPEWLAFRQTGMPDSTLEIAQTVKTVISIPELLADLIILT